MKLNPAVCREAEWRDGVLTLDTYAEVARVLGVPLYVEPEPSHGPRRGGYDADAIRALRTAEVFAQNNRQRQLEDGARRIEALDKMLAARLEADAMEIAS